MQTLMGKTNECDLFNCFYYLDGIHDFDTNPVKFNAPSELLSNNWNLHQVIYDPVQETWKWIFTKE